MIVFLFLFLVGIALKLEKEDGPVVSSSNPCQSLPSLARSDRKQLQAKHKLYDLNSLVLSPTPKFYPIAKFPISIAMEAPL